MRVDGFRFDLGDHPGARALWLRRGSAASSIPMPPGPGALRVKLIAEPWDCGPGGYQVGGFPPGWAEWNDRFRDTMRAFWKGDEARPADLAPRLARLAATCSTGGAASPGPASTSSPRMTASRCTTWSATTTSTTRPTARTTSDGIEHNLSWNCGAEGPTDDPEIIALRERQKRNMLATLLLSQGTPMLLAATSAAAPSRATTMPIARTMS
jgi:isoamylase